MIKRTGFTVPQEILVTSPSLLKIIQLTNGDIVLQPIDEDAQPLVTISFSDLSKDYIGEGGLEVAKMMIQAGIQAVAQMSDAQLHETNGESEEVETHILH